MKKILIFILLIISVRFSGYSQKQEVLHLIVEAGDYKRINTPVNICIDEISIIDTSSFELFEKINGHLVEKLFQVESDYNSILWFTLDGTTEPGSEREYILFSTDHHEPHENSITADVKSEVIILKKGVSEIFHYRKAIMYPPPGVDTVYKRSGFFHPVFSPSGNVLTRVSPPDHYHHFGIWNPWTRIKAGDHVSDLWNLYEKQGTVRFSGINSTVSGPVFGGFTVKQDHIDFLGKDPEQLIINEVCDVRAWNIEPVSGENAYLVDLTTFLSVAGTVPLTLEAYRYGGGIGIRANEEWTRDNSSVLTSEGRTRIDADGTRARWTDLNGSFIGGGTSGIVFFSHPSNRDHPEPMRVWPIDANNGRGDVYFEFCPVRLKEWILVPGNVYRLKYRILIYDGKIDKITADRLWCDFAYPPLVKVLHKQRARK